VADARTPPSPAAEGELTVGVEAIDVSLPVAERTPPSFNRPLTVHVREARLLNQVPWIRSLGTLGIDIGTEGWRFPVPVTEQGGNRESGIGNREKPPAVPDARRPTPDAQLPERRTRLKPPVDAVIFKDRLLYLLQPPLENLFAGKAVHLPFQPFPYQLEGIAFLMPRHAAMLADEMGLGKTVQTILALRLLFHANLIRQALLVCPKPLVTNWSRELRLWAEDVPFEVIGGDGRARRASWLVSNSPLKLVNYEVLTRDAALVADEGVQFDVVVLDEAQRIKNSDSKTAEAVKGLRRQRSWALTGTPIENKPDDLVNIFAFVDPGRIPPDTPAKRLPQLTADCILRRVKEDVLDDMPPRIVRDACLELSPAQKDAYALAEKEGVVRLNALGETISVQHVFELVMRLKQICNFDPMTGQSSKLEQLQADLAEVADSGRKAIVFSQWVEPLERIAEALAPYGPLQYHGKVPHRDRQGILDRFKNDPRKYVLLMSYGTGSVGLNLQFTNYVFLFDRWWNPAIEDQAINRAHRIGQKAPVIVTRFVSQGTIEERIAEVLERKRQVFNELIEQNGPPPTLGLSQEEVFGLFDLRVRPRRAA
jgi:SNF2 family DNA or RNA helicase